MAARIPATPTMPVKASAEAETMKRCVPDSDEYYSSVELYLFAIEALRADDPQAFAHAMEMYQKSIASWPDVIEPQP